MPRNEENWNGRDPMESDYDYNQEHNNRGYGQRMSSHRTWTDRDDNWNSERSSSRGNEYGAQGQESRQQGQTSREQGSQSSAWNDHRYGREGMNLGGARMGRSGWQGDDDFIDRDRASSRFESQGRGWQDERSGYQGRLNPSMSQWQSSEQSQRQDFQSPRQNQDYYQRGYQDFQNQRSEFESNQEGGGMTPGFMGGSRGSQNSDDGGSRRGWIGGMGADGEGVYGGMGADGGSFDQSQYGHQGYFAQGGSVGHRSTNYGNGGGFGSGNASGNASGNNSGWQGGSQNGGTNMNSNSGNGSYGSMRTSGGGQFGGSNMSGSGMSGSGMTGSQQWGGSTYSGSQYGNQFGGMSQSGSSQGQFSGRGPKNYNRSDDRIREDVCECLTQHPSIDASEIEVEVQNGEVTLTGSVNDKNAKRMAEDAVERLSGVKDVTNQLRVSSTMQGSSSNSNGSSMSGSMSGSANGSGSTSRANGSSNGTSNGATNGSSNGSNGSSMTASSNSSTGQTTGSPSSSNGNSRADSGTEASRSKNKTTAS